MTNAINIKPIVEGSLRTVILINVKAAARKMRSVISSKILIGSAGRSFFWFRLVRAK